MEKSEIPRLELSAFAQNSYQVPFLNVQHYPIDGDHFVIKNRDDYPVNDYISPNRRQFYKIFHMTSGTGILTVGLHQYHMSAGDIGFLHPDEIMSWQTTSKETGGHFCLINPKYFELDAGHVLQLFKQFPYFKANKAVIQLNESQSSKINHYFELMLQENEGDNEDKKQAILLHLQMLLLEAQRVEKILPNVNVSEGYNYLYSFLNLLESSFQVRDPNSVLQIKTASEFADQLNVHPNYLNRIVKERTGKTLREHIQERLIYEAKSLLFQTDWTISTIGYALGFSGPASFSSFFQKKERVSPSIYRKSGLLQPNI